MKLLKCAGKAILIIVVTLVILAAIVFLFLNFSPSVGKAPGKSERAELEKRSKHYYDGKFHNENAVTTMTGAAYPSSDRKIPKTLLRAKKPALLTDPQPGDLSFTWLGHSSFFLQMGTTNILVDPVFSVRSSPVQFAGPKRFSELPLAADELPEIDVLFISHDHYDHLDYNLIREIKDRVGAVIVPLGVDSILKGWGVDAERIYALDWWDNVEIGGISFTLTPSQHFTGRNPLKGNSTLWGGLYLNDGVHRVYYTGDGGYNSVFDSVRERLGAPELMLAECGQYDTAWASIHMFPEETVQAGIDAGAEWLIPVHWGSFSICNHAWDDSIRRVTAAAKNRDLLLATPQIGQTVVFSDIASYTEHWWEAYD
ncbi:MAG: MBL fold metallo-hydrolase [Oscillospiraceae bacterium]|nr:MBL fold metallo-hydrolase [Oscillospiraceae bacterium]